MAISIQNQPTYPNGVYTHLVYTVTSDESAQPQMQYIMDVTQNGEIVSRVKQYPNPDGAAVFDPSRILNDYISYDNHQKVSTDTSAVQSVQDFVIYFGEEYGTSLSSSVDIYNGQGSIGAPAVTGTPVEVIGAVVDPNNGSTYNFDTSSRAMTNLPSSGNKLAYTDYNTISYYNGGDLNSVTVDYNPGPTVVYNPANGFVTIPVSTQNIGFTGQYNTVTVTAAYAAKANEVFTFQKDDCANYDRVRFAFINNYGFFDYFGVNLPVQRNTDIQRESLRRPNVDYSSNFSQYNPNSRGKDYYNLKYTDKYMVVSDWLDQEHAEWLGEMLESPSVFVQQNNQFIPIVITNASYQHYTNTRSQKTFQYEIQYEYANQRLSR